MDQLIEKFLRIIAAIQTQHVRGLMSQINWDARLIGIKGARGVGKTTLILQYIKMNLSDNLSSVLYVSLDNFWFTENRLINLADKFVKSGGKHLFLDEVHKYANWSIELKNIYDDYPELKIVFTGSSLLEILNARADLSRRAVVYNMQGLSFREYLMIVTGREFPVYSLKNITERHESISREVVLSIKPFQYFRAYLTSGYYPFFKEQPDLYHIRIEEVVNMILEIELPQMKRVDVSFVIKIKQLMQIISTVAPFTPNILKLSERIGINRQTLLAYLYYLNEAHLLFSVYRDAKGISLLQKPDKIFIENTNLMFALTGSSINEGNLRETFFANQLREKHLVETSGYGDFRIDDSLIFELGGKSKGASQIRNQSDAFIATDDIEFGFQNKIPLWLFGFLY